MTENSLREMLDACRAAGRDLQDPEFAALAEALQRDATLRKTLTRSQELDAAISTAFRAAPLPAGLCDRLLAKLESETLSEDETAVSQERKVALARPPAGTVPPPSPRTRRRWIGVLATALAIGLPLLIFFSVPRDSQRHDLSSESAAALAADVWNEHLALHDQWEPATAAPSPSFPLPAGLRSGMRGWRWVAPQQIVCYDLATPGAQSRLFVLRRSEAVPAAQAPPAGYPSPRGWHVGAWKTPAAVYVLAVYSKQPSSSEVYRELRQQLQHGTNTLAQRARNVVRGV